MTSVIRDQGTQHAVDDHLGLLGVAQCREHRCVGEPRRSGAVRATRAAHVASRTAVGARPGRANGSLMPTVAWPPSRWRKRRQRLIGDRHQRVQQVTTAKQQMRHGPSAEVEVQLPLSGGVSASTRSPRDPPTLPCFLPTRLGVHRNTWQRSPTGGSPAPMKSPKSSGSCWTTTPTSVSARASPPMAGW
jgi:hypothetical protein